MKSNEAATVKAEVGEGPVRYDLVPHVYIASGVWPEATLTPDAPIGAYYAQEIARRLKAAMTDRRLSQHKLAQRSGVSQRTIGRVLMGDTYCDVATLARLEFALETGIYPTRRFRGLPEESAG